MREFHFYEPKLGHGLKHDPLNSIVAPRPIGWISSQSAEGVLNLAPYSFFNAFNYTPPIIGFSSIGWKDSVRNIAASKEFVWNLASRPLAEQMNTSSALVAPEVNEFELAGLATAPSRLVKPPRVLESPVSFECRLSDIVQLQNANGGLIDTWLVLGEVVAVHIDTAVLEDGVYNTVLAQPIMRGGGPTDYFSITESQRFHMHRPVVDK
jgi:flavin reductase (DIM6/NTAB) family NADH-FMN oxidoreductase RutF